MIFKEFDYIYLIISIALVDFKTFANIIVLICVITYQSINKISYNDISTLIFCYHM